MKKQKKMKYGVKLTIGMAIYAVIFCLLAFFGLRWFWGYIDSYEQSRPKHVLNGYMDSLTVSYIQDACWDLIDSVDHNIQSEESCRQVIADALSNGISYARKLSESTEDKTVYMLLSSGKTIGQFTMSAQHTDQYGFTTWRVTDDAFDLSFLMGQSTSITVPHNYSVYANGVLLTQDYITQSNIPYSALQDFADTYSLPYKVTYEIPAVLGALTLTVTDPNGNPVTAEQLQEEMQILNACTDDQITQIDTLVENFLESYVAYTTNAGLDRNANYAALRNYIIPGSSLDERMKDALDGLKWVPDRHAQITSITTNQRIPFLDGRILCDLTYSIRSDNHGGTADATFDIQIILYQTANGLKAETMFSS